MCLTCRDVDVETPHKVVYMIDRVNTCQVYESVVSCITKIHMWLMMMRGNTHMENMNTLCIVYLQEKKMNDEKKKYTTII